MVGKGWENRCRMCHKGKVIEVKFKDGRMKRTCDVCGYNYGWL